VIECSQSDVPNAQTRARSVNALRFRVARAYAHTYVIYSVDRDIERSYRHHVRSNGFSIYIQLKLVSEGGGMSQPMLWNLTVRDGKLYVKCGEEVQTHFGPVVKVQIHKDKPHAIKVRCIYIALH